MLLRRALVPTNNGWKILVAMTPLASKRSFSVASQGQSRGAISGGFSKGNLAAWANREWGDACTRATTDQQQQQQRQQPDHYTDLLSAKISGPCALMLEEHCHPSSALARAMFQSNQFAPERWILSTLMPSINRDLPQTFKRKMSYLIFNATDATPHELIFQWSGPSSSGCTMLAVDPKIRRIYLGSGIKSASFLESAVFRQILTPAHIQYSQFLLQGAVEQLEQQVATMAEKH